MQYSDIHKAVFLERPNRFIAHCTVDGMLETVHVKNTGRCRELLVPGATVYLEKSSNPNRKTAYDLVTVETPFGLVNMDAAAPNQVAGSYCAPGRSCRRLPWCNRRCALAPLGWIFMRKMTDSGCLWR